MPLRFDDKPLGDSLERALVVCFCISIITWYIFQLLVPQASVHVSTSQAILRIPITNRSSWDWNRAVEQPTLEYGWNITIPNSTQRYMFGYMLFNNGKQPTRTGSLAELLEVGQPLLQREVEFNQFEQEGVPVTFSLEQNVLVLRVQDTATIERVFASKPLTATLEITTPYEASTYSDIGIIYQP